MKATPASKPPMRAQSGVSAISSLFFATPSMIRFAAVRGTKCESVVQLVRAAGRGVVVGPMHQATSYICDESASNCEAKE